MKRKSGLMSSLGYGAAGTVRGKKGDEASLWGRRGRSHAQSVPASPRFSANGTDGTWAKPGHPCPVPKEKRGRVASLCWTWKVLLAILFFFEVLLYLYFWLSFFHWWFSPRERKWKMCSLLCVSLYMPFHYSNTATHKQEIWTSVEKELWSSK